MNKSDLKMYRGRKIRIDKLRRDICELEGKDITSIGGKVQTSMSEFPYIQCRTAVEIYDPKEEEKIRHQIKIKKRDIEKLQEQNDSVEVFINSIQSAMTKNIFELCYIDGLEEITQKEVANKLGLSRSKIARVIRGTIEK